MRADSRDSNPAGEDRTVTASLVSLEHVSKVFPSPGGEFRAVDDVSFDLMAGEAVGIVGESGSGKSTTARMIAGLERTTAGRITFWGEQTRPARTAVARRAQARRVQMVFQDPFGSLDPRQKLGACLAEILAIHGTPAGQSTNEFARTLLERVGLEAHHADSYPRHLSGGQRQRFAIARALAPQPHLLILDEAVSALDVSVQAQVLRLLSDLREETQLAYLFVSHDLAVVRQICDRVLVMRDGAVVEEGGIEQVLDDPQAAYTRRLIESVPVPGWTPPQRQPR
ncbi:ATP-binding cassette domain-containing protein [Microbacterium sp. LWO14-1.2]|uniref:ABC transporter ATP-binding protein n=1 Tax=Microbacterium sp. LWO14-1.2 TaxID=3135263 RepID=UPI003138CC49